MKWITSIALHLTFCCHLFGQVPHRGTSAFEGVTKAEIITKIPDFSQYKISQQKKKMFFDFLRPMVKEENQILLNEQQRIQGLFKKKISNNVISTEDLNWLEAMAVYYRVIPFDINSPMNQEELLQKVDIIPESLFLAQAANESAWGASRFAKSANNIFGQWCFTEGCGIVPNQRRAGETHEVQKFETLNESVTSYIHHLNSHPFYIKLRDSRANARKAEIPPSGYAMAIGLEKYSARGKEYVKEVRSMITYNKLEIIK